MSVATDWPTVSNNPFVQAFYEVCRENGQSHNIAEICAFRQSPTLRTGTRWLAGQASHPFGEGEIGLKMEQAAVEHARRQGVNPEGKVFISQLCREGCAMDPEAWVSDADELKARLRERGWGAAEFGIKPRAVEGPAQAEHYEVSDDLVDEELANVREEHPDVTPSEVEQLKADLKQRFSGESN